MAVVPDVTDVLAVAIDDLCAVDPVKLADPETVMAVYRQLDRLQAVAARVTAAFDAGRAWEADGARTASAWVAGRCHQPVMTARRRVQLGRALRHMPEVERAWLAGEISEGHVGHLASARTAEAAAFFERDEALLVAQAKELRFSLFVRALAYWRQRADPDGAERTAEAQYQARSVKVSQTFGGCWALDGLLDAVGGSIVATALNRIEDELFKAEWTEAKARVGDNVCKADLARTAAQRKADALVEMAKRATAAPEGARLPEPLLTVFVGYETLAGRICELADGTVVAPGSLLRWLDKAWVERAVFGGPDRVTSVGVRQRLFTGATRRAVELRDRECFHELCEIRADRCEVDHKQPWAQGGLTTQDNGRLACGFHNRARHRSRPPP